MKTIGVLALQGDFAEHIQLLKSMKIPAIEVRNKSDLEKCSALIVPGGESTTISKLLVSTGLDFEIKKRVSKGMPFYGTCAGAIIAAKTIPGEKEFIPLNLIDVEIKRNAFGRQTDSFETELDVKGIGKMNGIFIRAPIIVKTGKGIELLASFDGKPVLVRKKNILLGSFHPETEGNTKLHEYFLKMLS
ncbi:MAG TPA: pyridoxal 5'-phosphate synthase glutaminase subunit PdxT [archaeon]|nr:pyridoxal 5'-phosphate synthase glutaminase subunit PdxT [archaeon]